MLFSQRKEKSMKNLALFCFISAILLTAATLIGCSDEVTPREGAIEGRIVNLSGRAIKDALVEWQYDKTRWGITDENGKYYLDGVGFGDQYFVITANGYRSTTFTASVYSGKTTTVNDVSVQNLSFYFTDIVVEKTTATTALISWKTSDFTNSIIEYGTTEALGRYTRETAGLFTTTHKMEIINLEPEKTYYFKISANRQGQSIESSNISNFSTLSALEDGTAPNPPSNVEAALNGAAGQAVVFWNPNAEPDLKGYKVYRSEVANGCYSEVSKGFIPRGQERFTDKSTVTGKKYFYHVTAIDKANNESGYNNTAEILVPGNITGEVRWTVANSPYIVKGDINISEFGVLHIDPGVKVLIETTDALRSGDINLIEINVRGAIVASGGQSLPITIAANTSNPAKGSWKGITFTDVSNPSNSMVNFVISDADRAVTLQNSSGHFAMLDIINCNLGADVQNCANIALDKIKTKRCTEGINITNNGIITVTNSTFVHPLNCITSSGNSDLNISGCNFLEFTGTGVISNENIGNVEFFNNLFVSPSALALQINGKCSKIESSVFDTPYAIQIKSEIPLIQKNLFMAEQSLYSEGKKCIEYLGFFSTPEFGPNNVEGFSEANAYVGCTPSAESLTSSDIIFVKDISGEKYDYRLKQPFPSNSNLWGIIRDSNPYLE